MLPIGGAVLTVLFVWSVYATKIKKHKSTQTPIMELFEQTTQTCNGSESMSVSTEILDLDSLDMDFFRSTTNEREAPDQPPEHDRLCTNTPVPSEDSDEGVRGDVGPVSVESRVDTFLW